MLTPEPVVQIRYVTTQCPAPTPLLGPDPALLAPPLQMFEHREVDGVALEEDVAICKRNRDSVCHPNARQLERLQQWVADLLQGADQ